MCKFFFFFFFFDNQTFIILLLLQVWSWCESLNAVSVLRVVIMAAHGLQKALCHGIGTKMSAVSRLCLQFNTTAVVNKSSKAARQCCNGNGITTCVQRLPNDLKHLPFSSSFVYKNISYTLPCCHHVGTRHYCSYSGTHHNPSKPISYQQEQNNECERSTSPDDSNPTLNTISSVSAENGFAVSVFPSVNEKNSPTLPPSVSSQKQVISSRFEPQDSPVTSEKFEVTEDHDNLPKPRPIEPSYNLAPYVAR